jgi:hypothetical protein
MFGVFAGVAALAILLWSASAQTWHDQGYKVAGCWYANVYFGDPTNPATDKLPLILAFHGDGTIQWSSTGHWGTHPYLPGEKAGGYGIWERQGLALQGKGMWFDTVGGGLGLSVGRMVAELAFNGPDEIVGKVDFDFVPCPDGELGCVDPTQGDFLQMGAGAGPFPIIYHRLQ